MNIFVTGATGFLGQHLCRKLADDGHAVVGIHSANCDLRQSDSLDPFNDQQFDRIYHLAAWTQAGDFCLRHPGEQWIINQLINTHVLSWWKDHQPQAKMIAMASSCCYDPAVELVEEHFLVGDPIESLYTYGMTKRMLYIGLRMLARQFGLTYLCLVPSTLYGPDYHLDGRQMHFIFDLVRKIMEGKEHGTPVELWGDGRQARELIHVRDFVDVCCSLSDGVDNELVNVGSGEEHTIREFAEALCNMVGYDPDSIHYDTSKYTGARSKVLDIAKLRQLVPDLSLTPLEVGLKETVDWFRKAHS